MGEPLRLTPSATLGDDFLIPADAEIIIEGTIPPGVRDYQNPFGEISGHYQARMLVPVVEVTAICFKNNAMMQGLMPGHAEHIILGGLPKEGTVYWAMKNVVPEVTAVHLPHSAMGRFSAHIAVNKRTYRDVTVAAMIAFAEQPNLKLAIMVDSDIDVFNQTEVMWAVATQTRWDRDVTIIPRVQSFRSWLGDAVCIIDATHHDEVADYPEKNRIPEEAVKRLRELGF
jgi:2,5-furandicarboxylate decarboxylase 1